MGLGRGLARMRRIRRRWAVLPLAALLLLHLPPLPPLQAASAAAPESVYFVAAEDNILPLSDETMPFWNGGYLYLATDTFTVDVVREDLGISRVEDPARGLVALYSGMGSLIYELGEPYATDDSGNTYVPGLLQRGSRYFAPVPVIAAFFDLQYSVTEVEHGFLLWIHSRNYPVQDSVFANAAAYQLRKVYEEYAGEPEEAPPRQEPPEEPVPRWDPPEPAGEEEPVPEREPDLPVAPAQTDPPDLPEDGPPEEAENGAEDMPEDVPEEVAEEEPPIPGGQTLYLCFRAGEDAAEQADILERRDIQALFLCGPDFLAREGAFLRRLTATGQGIGLIAGGAGELEAANRLLERAAFRKTRLAMAEGGAIPDAAERGFRLVTPQVDWSPYPLTDSARAEELLRFVGQTGGEGGTVSVLLGGGTAGLEAFLSAAEELGDRFALLTETAPLP